MAALHPFWNQWMILIYVCLGLLAVIIYRRFCSSLSDIPGPFWASCSRLWHIWHIIIGDQNLRLIEMHEKYGPFVRVAHNEVSVSHPEAVRMILRAPLYKAPWYRVMAIPDYRFQNPFSTLDPPSKVRRSKHFASGYSTSNLLKAEGSMDDHFKTLMGWIDRFAKDKMAMDLDKFLSYAAADIAGEMLFSESFGFLKVGSDIDCAIANSVSLNLYVALAGFFHSLHVMFLGNPLVTKLKILPMGHLYNTCVTALSKREQNLDARFDMVAHWFRVQQQEASLTKQDVSSQVINSVGGGSDSISCGIQSFVYFMIRYPAVLRQVRAEITRAQSEGRCMNRIISFADSQKLPFLQACIKECLRVFCPVGIGMARVVGQGGVKIGNRLFPEGTQLSVNPWVIHHSEECWGPDAGTFNPSRWLTGQEDQEKNFIPWGAGYGSCPGQHLARIELSKICPTLARDYDIRQAEPTQEWKWRARILIVSHSWPVYISKRLESQSGFAT